jgi:hypothetical protein
MMTNVRRILIVALLALPQPAYAATPDPVIVRFTVAPTSIPAGSGATLCVAARHATELSISGLGEFNPSLLDCRHVAPLVTTTYTTWALNRVGVTVSESVTLTVTHSI